MAGDDLQAKVDALRQAVRQLSVLVEISVTLNESLDLNTVLALIVREAKKLLRCEGASILLYDAEARELFFAESSSIIRDKLMGRAVPLRGSLAGKAFLSRQVVINNRADADPQHYARVGEQLRQPVTTVLAVPLLVQGQPIGVLEAVNKRGGAFDDDDGGLLSVLASQAAVAINNARLLAEIRKAYDDVREADRLKSDFMALASHELRTPLGIIIGYASFLQDEQETGVASHADEILKAAMRMRRILDDMTGLTLMRQSADTAHLTAVDVREAFRRAFSDLDDEWRTYGHQVKRAFADGIRVTADPEWLTRVLKNVLHNAMRFTEPGGVITVGAIPQGKQGLIWVQDTGIGLEKDQLERIFNEFYQAEDHMTRQHGGLGIGLSIARALIQAQNGKIWAESPGPGRGTRINILLPLAQQETSPFLV